MGLIVAQSWCHGNSTNRVIGFFFVSVCVCVFYFLESLLGTSISFVADIPCFMYLISISLAVSAVFLFYCLCLHSQDQTCIMYEQNIFSWVCPVTSNMQSVNNLNKALTNHHHPLGPGHGIDPRCIMLRTELLDRSVRIVSAGFMCPTHDPTFSCDPLIRS